VIGRGRIGSLVRGEGEGEEEEEEKKDRRRRTLCVVCFIRMD